MILKTLLLYFVKYNKLSTQRIYLSQHLSIILIENSTLSLIRDALLSFNISMRYTNTFFIKATHLHEKREQIKRDNYIL